MNVSAPASLPTVTATLLNATNATPKIYRTSDSSYNKIMITITNGLNGSIRFGPGTPVAYGELPAGASAVYLLFNGLLGNDEIAAMSLAASGWSSATFEDPRHEQSYLVIAPTAAHTLPAGGTIEFALNHVVVAEAPTSGTATVVLAGATGLTAAQAELPLFIDVANPPKPADRDLWDDLQIEFTNPTIYVGQPSELILRLVNLTDKSLVRRAWDAGTPTFRLQPIYGTGPGALTTVDDAKGIEAAIHDERQNVWKAVGVHAQGPQLSWFMQPDPNGGSDVIGTGGNALVEFSFSKILAAPVPAGFDSADAVVYISWSGIPGYFDDSRALIVTKRPGISIVTFRADPATIAFDQQTVTTTLTWDTRHAGHVRFGGVPGVSSSQTFETSGSGPVDGGFCVARGAELTITAVRSLELRAQAAPGAAPKRAQAAPASTQRGDDQITTSANLTMRGVVRADIPDAVGNPASIVIPPGHGAAYVTAVSSSRIAVVDTATRTVTQTLDLAELVDRGVAEITSICAAACGPAGVIYFVATNSDENTPSSKPWIVPFHTASRTAGTPVGIGRGRRHPTTANLVTGTGAVMYATVGGRGYGALEVVALDVSTLAVTARCAPWNVWDQLLGWVAGITADQSAAILYDIKTVSTMVVSANNPSPRATFDLAGAGLSALRTPTVSPDGLTVWVVAVDQATLDIRTRAADVVLVELRLDASGASIMLGRRIRLTRSDAESLTGSTAPYTLPGYGSWVALTDDANTAYVAVPSSDIAVVDLVRSHADLWTCGHDAASRLWPSAMQAGAQSNSAFVLHEHLTVVSLQPA